MSDSSARSLEADKWTRRSLGDICINGGGSIQTGPFGSQLHAEDYQEEGVPIITVEHLRDGCIAHQNLPLVGKSDFQRLRRYMLSAGDLVFSRVGSIDRCAYVSDSEDGWLFSGRCLRVRAGNGEADSRFLAYLLNSCGQRQWILNHSVGSTMACLNTAILSAVPIELPPKSQQRMIAKILTTLDNLIEKTEILIAKYQAIKQGMMHDLFTRGVDAHGHLRPPQSEASDLYKQSDLGWIPKEWDVAHLVSFASDSQGAFVNGPFGSDLLTTELTGEGVPVIYVRDIKPGQYERVSTVHVTEQKANQLVVCNVFRNDVLIAKVGDPPCDAAPYLNSWRSIITQDVIRIRVAKDVDSKFLSHLLNSPMGRNAIRHITIEGTRARVSLTQLKTLELPKPPLLEQESLAAKVESLLTQIRTETNSVAKYKEAKMGLMQDLLTGKVRVRVDESEEFTTHV